MAYQIQWHEQLWELLPELALYWPAQRTLIVADPHFGKDVSFRSAGIPVPGGTTKRDVERIDIMSTRTQAAALIILGDFFHNRASRNEHTVDVLSTWREGNRHISVVNIRGNHDRHAGDPPENLDIQVVDEPWSFAGMTFRHHPTETDVPHICGHLHPSIRLTGRATSSIVLPCFWTRPLQLVCPAFGGFTGTSRIHPHPEDRIYVSADNEILEVPIRK